MSIGDEVARPQLVSGDQADEPADVRVSAVLEVLAGRPSPEVARRWAVPAALLHRWVRTFVRAGTAAIDDPSLARLDDDTTTQRDRFLAAFTHEVQVPVQAASGWAAMLREGAVPPQRVPAALDRICESLDALAERAADLELLSKAALGRLALHRRVISAAELVGDLPGLPGIDGEGGAVALFVDGDHCARVLRDLWRAAGQEPTPTDLRLETRTVSPWTEIAVIRVGAPIDPVALRGLFDPFHPTGPADDETGGTIGLYLARALAVAHGGTIGARQDHHHTVLWVRVPRHSVNHRPA